MTFREIVEKLYNFRDHYFEHHSTDHANKKAEDLASELETTLKILDEKTDDESKNKMEYNLFRAKALNVLPDFNPEALEILTKVVKFHPRMVEAWNELGECFAKKNDIKAAKSCFENALKEEKNAESLRNLSMILRQFGDTPEEKMANVHLSVEKAKDALNLNIQDGKSWYILGNAFLSLFFTTNQNPNMLKQSLSSYSHAIVDDRLKCNPDLHFNRGMALQYDENFRMALESFDKAVKYDPLWDAPRDRFEKLTKHLGEIQNMIESKGKLKPRKLREFSTALKTENEKAKLQMGVDSKSKKPTVVTRLKFSDLHSGSNARKEVHGKVVCQVYSDDNVLLTFCVIDEEGTCFAVNIYNMAQGKGFIIGDSVTVTEPYVQHFSFTYKEKVYKFSAIRVNSPLQLTVNKRKLGLDAQATPCLSITLTSD